jgi:hypothetical protein
VLNREYLELIEAEALRVKAGAQPDRLWFLSEPTLWHVAREAQGRRHSDFFDEARSACGEAFRECIRIWDPSRGVPFRAFLRWKAKRRVEDARARAIRQTAGECHFDETFGRSADHRGRLHSFENRERAQIEAATTERTALYLGRITPWAREMLVSGLTDRKILERASVATVHALDPMKLAHYPDGMSRRTAERGIGEGVPFLDLTSGQRGVDFGFPTFAQPVEAVKAYRHALLIENRDSAAPLTDSDLRDEWAKIRGRISGED